MRETLDVTVPTEQAAILAELSRKKQQAAEQFDVACAVALAGKIEGAGEASVEAIGPDFVRVSVTRPEEADATRA